MDHEDKDHTLGTGNWKSGRSLNPGQRCGRGLPVRGFSSLDALWLDHAHLNGAGCSWAAGEGPPQCSEQSWKNTRAEMSQRLSKCVVKKWKVREQWKVKKHQMVVKGKKKA